VKSTGREPDPSYDRFLARGLALTVDASGNACPDADLLAAWFDHTLSALEGERSEAHVSGCKCCQQILAALARSEPEVIRAAPLPAPSRPWHWHWRWAVPLATAVLVIVVGTKTLISPGPVTVVGTPPQQARLRPSGSGEASPPSVQAPAATIAEVRAPEPGAATAKPEAPARAVENRAVSTMPPTPPSPPPVQAEAAQAAAPTGAGAPQAAAPTGTGGLQPVRPEQGMVEIARRQADVASEQTLMKAAATRPPAPGPPPPPTAAESLAVKGGAARPALAVVGARPASLAASIVAGPTVSWRFGRDGTIEKSPDRGQTWERQSSGVTTALSDASAPGDKVCWIVGARGVVLRTTDGQTWQRLTSPTDADLVAVHAWNDLSAAITALDHSEYETADGGKTWRQRRH